MLETGGKRLRPRLLFAAAELGEHPEDPRLVRAAAAIEIFHCASLVHDDVIDDSPFRRDASTVARRTGNGAAALAGGWLFGTAAQLACSCGDGTARRFADATNRVCEGQMLELADLYDRRRSLGRYFEAISGKTAALFALATAAGAELAGAADDVVERAAACGHDLGVAYQLLDDLEDVAPGPSPTGKPPLHDLEQGVYTLPVLHAVDRDPRVHDLLEGELSEESARAVAAAVRATGGERRAGEEIRAWTDAARESVAGLPGAENLQRMIDESVTTRLVQR